MGKRKMRFELQDNESIDECMERMKKLGYSPISRIEKPIFQEVINGSQKTYEPVVRQIIFEALEVQ